MDWSQSLKILREYAEEEDPPTLMMIKEEGSDPYRILVGTVLSLRTRDETTLAAARKLFAAAPDMASLAKMDPDDVEPLIIPVGFYKTKSVQLVQMAKLLMEQYAGQVPRTREELLALPGVGRKTANLVLSLAYGVEAICVDTHVHRIANRLGWVATKDAEETEHRLMQILPREYWAELNELMVIYGQEVCTPVSPHCSQCAFGSECPRIGVVQHR